MKKFRSDELAADEADVTAESSVDSGTSNKASA